jgi:hypothetical protein
MGLFGRLTGADQQSNAAMRSDRATQQAISQSRDEINATFPQIQNLYNQGNDAQMGYMQDVAGNYSGLAGMLNPALQNLQSTGTAGGRAEALMGVMNDPNQQMLFDQVAKNTMEDNRAMGLGRSGYGMGMSQQAKLGLADNLLNRQDQQQQLMAGYGMSGNDNLSRIQMGMGQLAGDRYNNQANLDMQRLNMINNLTAQSGQSTAAMNLAQGNAAAAGLGSLLSLSGTLGGAYLGRPQ